MIHAYCYTLNIQEANGGHGSNFRKIMLAINLVNGTSINVCIYIIHYKLYALIYKYFLDFS